jgi:hypothetical protein
MAEITLLLLLLLCGKLPGWGGLHCGHVAHPWKRWEGMGCFALMGWVIV